MLFPGKVLTRPKPDEIEICVFGPGYGESIVVHIPGEGWGVIDCCATTIDKQRVVPPLQYIQELFPDETPEISFVILTHPHKDHYDGFFELITAFGDKIKRSCLYSGESLREYTAYLSTLSVAEKTMPPFSKVYTAFRNLYKAGVSPRLLQELSVIFDISVDVNSNAIPIKFLALSPSTKSVQDYNSILRSSLPSPGQPFIPIADTAHNLVSVATLLCVGQLQFVFGSDLEVGHDDYTGWRCVLLNPDIPKVNAHVVKVSHHGSEGAYFANAWNAHSTDGLPVSIVTPFNRCTPPLPTDDGLLKICKSSSICGITHHAAQSNKLDSVYPKDISMVAKQFTKSWQILPPNRGVSMIRTRFALDGTMTEQMSSHSAKWLTHGL